MTRSERLSIAAAVALALPAAAWAAEPSREQLMGELQTLQARVATLQGQQTQAQADAAATVDSVMRDAENRSHLLAAGEGGSAGWDNGFFIKSGDFTLKPGAHIQARYVLDYRKDGKHGDSSDTTTGFEIRRARLEVGGSAWGADYYIQWDASRSSGAVSLLDAYVTVPVADQIYVRAGQYKVYAFHEEDISDKYQLAVEKSEVNTFLGGGITGRVQGASLIYGNYADDKNPIYAEVQYHDGDSSLNTDFTHTGGKDWGAALRFEFKVMGNWSSYKDFTSKGLKQDLLVIGGGIDLSDSSNLMDYLFTVDAQYKSQAGFTVYGAVLVQYAKPRNLADDSSTTNWGGLIQASYLFSNQFEGFARYDLTHFDNELATGQKNVHEITAGVNYFLGKDGAAGNKAKLSVDIGWLPKGSPANTGAGIQGGTDKSEIIVRTQLNFVI